MKEITSQQFEHEVLNSFILSLWTFGPNGVNHVKQFSKIKSVPTLTAMSIRFYFLYMSDKKHD